MMMFGWLSLLNPASLGFKVAIFLLVIAATNTFTAIKVHNYVATEYQNIALTEKVAIVTKEKTIAVLDTVTLGKALKAQQTRLETGFDEQRKLDAIINSHKTDTKPWCELDSRELCAWNRSARKLLDGDPADPTECPSELPDTSGSKPDSK